MNKPILTSLSPNVQSDDIKLALKLLFKPKNWIEGAALLELEGKFSKLLGAQSAVSFSSGRACLYAILSSLDLTAQNEVLMQAYTCVAVADPIIWIGAKPIYIDCEEGSFNMSPADLERKITPQSKVLIIQHTFGAPAKIDELAAIAKKHNLFVIEDCAHSLGSTYKNKLTGTFGDASFFSLGRDKVISSVFGGMVVTNNSELAQKIRNLQNKLTRPKNTWVIQQLLHPLITELAHTTYNWLNLGKIIMKICKTFRLTSLEVEPIEKLGGKPKFTDYRMPNALAELALLQLNKLEKYNRHRQTIAAIYQQKLINLPITLPITNPETKSIFLRFTILTQEPQKITALAKKENIILGNWYQTPIAPSNVNYQKIYYNTGSCPNAEAHARKTLNLPTDIHTTPEDATRITKLIRHTYE